MLHDNSFQHLMEIKGCMDLIKNVENLQSHCEFQLYTSGS